jgi:adenylate cyclase
VYKGEAVDIRRVGEELQVDYVLEGSIRKAGARVRISTQLSAAQDGANLWSERYDRELDDIFSLQDEITETIAATIEPELARSERRRAHRKSSTDLGAWDLFQQAQWHMYQFSKENVQSGIALYQRAIAADDEFASAHAGLAVGYLILVGANLSENADEDIAHALESARRSVVLDDQDPFCHYALGRAEAFSFNHAKAESELKQAISMNPSYAHAYHGLAHLYMMTPGGDAEVASGLMDDAIRLSPKDPLRWVFEHMKGVTLLNLNRDDEALGWMERAATYPNAGFWAFSGLAAVQAALQNSDQAAKALSQALEVNPNLSQRFLEDTYPGALVRYKECLRIAGLTE